MISQTAGLVRTEEAALIACLTGASWHSGNGGFMSFRITHRAIPFGQAQIYRVVRGMRIGCEVEGS